MVGERLKTKIISDMLEAYAIQPKLDKIGHTHYLHKCLTKFRSKVLYIRGRNSGQNLHEFEIRAYKQLGVNLMRKAFSGLKVVIKQNGLKRMEEDMIVQYQFRKWFTKWRNNYLIKANNNYFT